MNICRCPNLAHHNQAECRAYETGHRDGASAREPEVDELGAQLGEQFNCCGGNDATPQEHTADCSRYAWREHYDDLMRDCEAAEARLAIVASVLRQVMVECECGLGFQARQALAKIQDPKGGS